MCTEYALQKSGNPLYLEHISERLTAFLYREKALDFLKCAPVDTRSARQNGFLWSTILKTAIMLSIQQVNQRRLI
jgi:hypothetical protein